MPATQVVYVERNIEACSCNHCCCGKAMSTIQRTMGTGFFSGVKSGRGVTLTFDTLLVPWSRKGRAIPLLPRMGLTACTEPQCLYKGALYLYHTT